MIQLFQALRTAFPDFRMEPEDILVDGDKIVARVRATGTHRGEFMRVPASGKKIDVQLIDITRFGEDGLAHEHWGVLDALSMMQQMGAISPRSQRNNVEAVDRSGSLHGAAAHSDRPVW